MEKLFEPFSQEDVSYSKNYEGNGIGLTLVKRCCELLNSQIDIQSFKNEGTSVTVKFKA
ncbi:MAG: hypothetical protein KJ799_09185 [Bacteroidetes bacterium]|nr:hypothetical protein [Bacteroidota bacterium]MBU1679508.1 hypothetical protein [Bacteroidota bacterium]MBU2506882.1 hypothetical protein [Bacteroidota bacterium]